jgi:ribonuclease HI
VIRLWTDGCCLRNPGGAGGWAFVMEERGQVLKTRRGGDPSTTNNRMELLAAIEALRWVADIDNSVQICSDSKYVVEGMNTWRFKWRVIGWRKKPTSRGKVKNAALWEELDRLATARPVDFRWVKGHAGANFNEQADQLAYAAAEEAAGEDEDPLDQLDQALEASR